MEPRLVIASLRPGWSRSQGRTRTLLAAMVRVAVLLFAFHVSGAAHLLADVLLDDDLTCVDDLARSPSRDATAPRCPASQGVDQGQGVAPPETRPIRIPAPAAAAVSYASATDLAPPTVFLRSIDRPPRI